MEVLNSKEEDMVMVATEEGEVDLVDQEDITEEVDMVEEEVLVEEDMEVEAEEDLEVEVEEDLEVEVVLGEEGGLVGEGIEEVVEGINLI